jgi:Mrp family chromosome partitioning ATPase
MALGLGLAFFIDLVLDRTFKRRTDVERHLHLPMFLSIPDMAWSKGRRAAEQERGRSVAVAPVAKSGNSALVAHAGNGTAPWDDRHGLRIYMEGLRERLITYFEVNNLNHKPKLVAVTGCTPGAGVSTMAGGLAAALSKTGTGNVLLVDMNNGEGTAQSFHKGKPGCDLAQPLEPDDESARHIETRPANGTHPTDLDGAESMLAKVLPSSFNQLVPRLRAADYDYIIFDMPPVTQTSVTPRLASHMDMVLLILESEKTKQRTAQRANELLHESRANVATVLNKCRNYVPERLSHE